MKNPHETYDFERDSPEIYVCSGIIHDKNIGPFFFAEQSIAAQIYFDVLIEYMSQQFKQYQPQVIFQQDSVSPNCDLKNCEFLYKTVPDRWIGLNGSIPWPPRFPDITPLDVFCGAI